MSWENLKPRIDQLGYDFADDIRDKFLPKIDDIRLNMEWDIHNVLDIFVRYLSGSNKSIGKIINEFNNCIVWSDWVVWITGYLKKNNHYKKLFINRYNWELDNLNNLKTIFKNLYNKIIEYYKKASENNTDKNISKNLYSLENDVITLKNNVIDLLIILEESSFTKKLLENFKRRNEIEPIPSTIGLMAYSFRKLLKSIFNSNNTQGGKQVSTNN